MKCYTSQPVTKKMRNLNRFVLAAILAALAAIGFSARAAWTQEAPSAAMQGLRWRLIGPFRGGRTIAATGVPGKPYEFYFGAVAGGVWKTDNAGRTWQPIFDAEPIASIGAIAVAPSDPQTIYVGSGEADMRSDISFGDGMYKSTDGGATWKQIGLRDTQQIGRVIVDPHDAKIVLVAALGHGYGPNAERGVYRTTDGGTTWTKVLGKDDDTGAIDVAFDPGNASLVYAALWQARRPAWTQYGPTNGPGSGLYKSNDGGATWTQITGGGFPSEGLGRIGIAVAPGNGGQRVYAIVDARQGGLYRSDDAGANWKLISGDHRIWQRGWYFGGVTVDPHDANVVYVCNTSTYRSSDGGEHFEALKGAPGGDDYHQLWIAPDDPGRMILASDQGAVVSVDDGATWSSWYNQPTAQMYHVTTDNRFPYRVYGAQQDSGTAAVLSRSDYGQISFRDWAPVGGEESGYIALDPREPDVVYGGGPYGGVSRFNWSTGQSADIAPWPVAVPGGTLRFNWNAPTIVSPQNPQVVYFAAQFVFKTKDGGASWQKISPDLTVRETPQSKAPAAKRAKPAAEESVAAGKSKRRGEVYTLAASPVRAGEIWAGSDNGAIHLTTDEGAHWTDVTPAGLAEWSMVSLIEASHFDAGTAYAAVDRHQLDDYHPYIYRTRDGGKTWANTVTGLPVDSYVHVVREDTVRKGLLFAGTETAIWVSFDDGDHWQPLRQNLPVTPIHDIAVHGDDLVVATHGRSFWVLDDIEPLREWSEKISARDAYLFAPAPAYRVRRSENRDTPLPIETPVGENPPAGAIVDYWLQGAQTGAQVGEVRLEIHEATGALVREFSSNDPAPPKPGELEFPDHWLPKIQTLETAPGMHRFVWDLRYPPPAALRHEYSMGALIHGGTQETPEGPLVPAGTYQVWLVTAGGTQKQALKVEMDPRVKVSSADLARQLDLEKRIDDSLTRTTRMAEEVAAVRKQLADAKAQITDNAGGAELREAVEQFDRRAEEILGKDVVDWPGTPGGLRDADAAFGTLAISVGQADAAPTAQAGEIYADYKKKVDALAVKWGAMKRQDIPALNAELQKAGLSPIDLAAEKKSHASD
ncbi:MAG: hypothetical protein WA875_02245 [Candidatus Acidiferrales bacterium]